MKFFITTITGDGKNGTDGENASSSDLDNFKSAAHWNWTTGSKNYRNAKNLAYSWSNYGQTTDTFTKNGDWGYRTINSTLRSGKKMTYVCWNFKKCWCLIQGAEGTNGGRGGNLGFGGKFQTN